MGVTQWPYFDSEDLVSHSLFVCKTLIIMG